MAIHSQRGKPSCSTKGGGSSLARTVGGGDAQNRGDGGGDAAEGEGYPVPQGKTAGDILFHRGGGGRGEYTMASITFCIRVRNRIPWGGAHIYIV